MQGESVTTPDWVQGGGPVREALSSKLNDLIKGQAKGFDMRGLKTEFVALDDPSLARGRISQDTKRVGSLQDAAPPGSQTVENMWNDVLKGDGKNNPQTVLDFKAKFNEDDCQAIALRQFLTFDQDAHCGNMMCHSEGPGPGQTRLIPIDAGQSLPNSMAAKRNAGALRIAGKIEQGIMNSKNLLMPQLPAATKPFSGKAKEAIEAIDPDKLSRDMKAEYDKLVQQEPSARGTVDSDAFDLVRKSAKLLKLAAKQGLTLQEISNIYGEGFNGVIAAKPDEEDKAIADAVNTFSYLKQQAGGSLDGLDDLLVKKGFASQDNLVIRNLRMDQKERILRNNWTKDQWDQEFANDLRTKELLDIADYFDATAPESAELPALLKNGFQGKDLAYLELLDTFRKKGGDPVIKQALAGNDATLALELKKTVAQKAGGGFDLWKSIGQLYADVGGDCRSMLAVLGPAYIGKPLDLQLDDYAFKPRYDENGGDALLDSLGKKWLTLYSTSIALDSTGAALEAKGISKADQDSMPKTQAELNTLLANTIVPKKNMLAKLKAMEKKKAI
jgi:hypothetical protein